MKQSTAANNLKCKSKGWGSTSSSEAEGPDDEISPSNDGSEFVSDTFQGDGSSAAEEVQKGMKALGVKRGDSKTSTGTSDGKSFDIAQSSSFLLLSTIFFMPLSLMEKFFDNPSS